MFSKGYKSDIVLGDKYEDILTGVIGTAISVHFYLHSCERVVITWVKDGDVKEMSVDAPGLRHVESGEIPVVEKTGGPGDTAVRPALPSR